MLPTNLGIKIRQISSSVEDASSVWCNNNKYNTSIYLALTGTFMDWIGGTNACVNGYEIRYVSFRIPKYNRK